MPYLNKAAFFGFRVKSPALMYLAVQTQFKIVFSPLWNPFQVAGMGKGAAQPRSQAVPVPQGTGACG